ncbi:hypothetical protein PG988_001901 [Apiospora saccharicola]
MDVVASPSSPRRDMKPRAERRLKRAASNASSRISGLSSLAGSVRSITSSACRRGDSVRSKISWTNLACQEREQVIEPDQDILSTLTCWNPVPTPRRTYRHKATDEPDAADEDDYERHNATRDGGVLVARDGSRSADPADHNCPLDHLDVDVGVPTTYSDDKGSAQTEDYIMQVQQEFEEAKENVRKAKRKLNHYSLLYDQALQSKDFDKPPSRCPDLSPVLGQYYDRPVMNTTTSPEDRELSPPPLVHATRHYWDVMAQGEAKVEKWQRAVEEWEEIVVQLHAESLSFEIYFGEDSEEEEEVEIEFCDYFPT